MSNFMQARHKFALVYRAIVEPLKYSDPERVVFVEAFTRDDARRKITTTIAAIDCCPAEQVSFYNLNDVRELLEEHFSEDCEMRLFETGGGCRDGVPYETYCEHPLVLTKDPRALLDVWMRCPRTAEGRGNPIAAGERDGLHG